MLLRYNKGLRGLTHHCHCNHCYCNSAASGLWGQGSMHTDDVTCSAPTPTAHNLSTNHQHQPVTLPGACKQGRPFAWALYHHTDQQHQGPPYVGVREVSPRTCHNREHTACPFCWHQSTPSHTPNTPFTAQHNPLALQFPAKPIAAQQQ